MMTLSTLPASDQPPLSISTMVIVTGTSNAFVSAHTSCSPHFCLLVGLLADAPQGFSRAFPPCTASWHYRSPFSGISSLRPLVPGVCFSAALPASVRSVPAQTLYQCSAQPSATPHTCLPTAEASYIHILSSLLQSLP